jgi:hypothetical protein
MQQLVGDPLHGPSDLAADLRVQAAETAVQPGQLRADDLGGLLAQGHHGGSDGRGAASRQVGLEFLAEDGPHGGDVGLTSPAGPARREGLQVHDDHAGQVPGAGLDVPGQGQVQEHQRTGAVPPGLGPRHHGASDDGAGRPRAGDDQVRGGHEAGQVGQVGRGPSD